MHKRQGYGLKSQYHLINQNLTYMLRTCNLLRYLKYYLNKKLLNCVKSLIVTLCVT